QRRDVMRMVMRQGVRLAITGALLGMGGALLVARAMSGLLVGVNGTDPLILGAAVLLLTAVAIAGCWIPARRAVGIDPISALAKRPGSACGGVKPPPRTKLAATDGKAALTARVKETFDFCNEELAKLDDSKLAEPMNMFGMSSMA